MNSAHNYWCTVELVRYTFNWTATRFSPVLKELAAASLVRVVANTNTAYWSSHNGARNQPNNQLLANFFYYFMPAAKWHLPGCNLSEQNV